MHRFKRGLFPVLLTRLLILLSSTPVFAQVDEQKRAEKEENLFAETNVNSVDRIKGDNRYLTAIEVSKAGWDSADTVVLARGDDYADALTSVPLAYEKDGPILLTPSDRLLDSTKRELKRLGVSKVIIVGGESAISSKVEEAIRMEEIEVTRIAGKDRFETATFILDEFERVEGVFIANGLNFPDALSAAPYAARLGIPILLTRANSLPTVTKEKLVERDIYDFIIMGGTKVVSDDVWFDLPGYKFRIGGENRFSTNVMMAEEIWVNEAMFVSTGMDYADALTGAVLAAKHATGILLVRPDNVPNVVANFIERHELRNLTVFGGNGAISEGVSKELERLLQ